MKAIPLLLAGLSGLAFAAELPALETPPKSLAAPDWSSIRAAYEAGRHAIQRQENGNFTALNPRDNAPLQGNPQRFMRAKATLISP